MRASLMMRWSGAFKAVVLLAFLARALVPPGFMFAPADVGLKVVVCTAHGMIEAYYDPETGGFSTEKTAPKKSSGGEPPCAFGALAKLAPPGSSVVVPYPSTASLALDRLGYVIPGRGLSAPPPPSTGPPSLNA